MPAHKKARNERTTFCQFNSYMPTKPHTCTSASGNRKSHTGATVCRAHLSIHVQRLGAWNPCAVQPLQDVELLRRHACVATGMVDGEGM